MAIARKLREVAEDRSAQDTQNSAGDVSTSEAEYPSMDDQDPGHPRSELE